MRGRFSGIGRLEHVAPGIEIVSPPRRFDDTFTIRRGADGRNMLIPALGPVWDRDAARPGYPPGPLPARTAAIASDTTRPIVLTTS